ncbi:hypothetical protein I79_002876 [Cricetulus griseus]|uniref:Uncharacterized protein n=1 Tax=Cricetulus griseus TaxID=10029 RepID=G3GYJ6_CRIGR|nr:hypothetical protein I79_002876 [Cricetulus griseus]
MEERRVFRGNFPDLKHLSWLLLFRDQQSSICMKNRTRSNLFWSVIGVGDMSNHSSCSQAFSSTPTEKNAVPLLRGNRDISH